MSAKPCRHEHDRRTFERGVADLVNTVGVEIGYEPDRQGVVNVDVVGESPGEIQLRDRADG